MGSTSVTEDPRVHCIKDLKGLGSAKLSKMYREFINEGSMDMVTLRDNELAFDRYKIRPRVLVNVENIDISTEIFGQKVSMPLGLAPTAMHKLVHPEGEVATSRAAAKLGVCMSIASYATASLEDVIAQRATNPYVLQVTMLQDKVKMRQLIERAETAGCDAILLSVDLPALGKRLNEYRNGFNVPEGIGWPNVTDVGQKHTEETRNVVKSFKFDASMDWNTSIPWIRSVTNLPIWLKGVMSSEDALLAVEYKLDGIIISNHGGRQLDGLPASLDALRECATVAKGKIPIAIDGGINKGTDIFKALALGANYCFVGRVPMWGLAYNGQDGVELALNILMQEFRATMGLAGCRSIAEITPAHLGVLNSEGALVKVTM